MINILTKNGYIGFAPSTFIKSSVVIPIFLFIAIWHTIKLVRHQASPLRFVLVWAFYLYAYAVVTITLFPISWFSGNSPIHQHPFGEQYMLTLNPINWLNNSKLQIIGNVLLLVPLTLMGGLLFPKLRTLLRAITVAFSVSFVIELSQLVMNYFYLGNRVFDTGDLILNTTGGLIGYVLLVLLMKIFPKEVISKALRA